MGLNYDWNFGRLLQYRSAFLSGTATTLLLASLVILIGTVLGVLVGFALRNRWMKIGIYPAIDVVRALPPLVFILFMYYLLTRQVIGISVQAFWVCAIAMSLNLAAFTSDLVRSSIETVPAGIVDAGRSLGMSQSQVRRHIVLPHVLRSILPGMIVLYIGLLKMTSLASIINVREVVYTAQTVIANVSRSLEAWTVVGLIYVSIVVPATYGARRLESWAKKGLQSVTERRT